MLDPHLVLQALMRQNLHPFTEKVFGTVVPGDPFMPNWHLGAITHRLQEVMAGRIRRLLITVPPRNAKSICASVAFPAWILGRDPTRRIICVSYAQDLATKLHNQTRLVMGSPWYRGTFAGTALSARKNTEAECETTRGGWRLATSVGGVITGRGANIIIIDDPIKPGDAMSETVRTATNTWYDMTLSSRLDDKTEGAIILVMQRLHVDDLAGHVLEKKGWTHLNLPAIATVDEDIPIGTGRVHTRRQGDLPHETREPMWVLDNLKADLGTADFSAQYQQQPVPLGGNMIEWAWFRRFAGAFGREPDDAIVQSWDTASKVTELNDYSVCTTWLIRDETFYLLDLHRERLDAPNLRRRVMELYDRYRPECILIEDKGSGTSVIQELRHAGRIPVIDIMPEGDKVVRAHSQAARIEGGQVYLPEAAHWLADLQLEVLAFPNSRHDDQVDSMAQFLIWAAEREYGVPRIREL